MVRGLPLPSDSKPGVKTTIYDSAEKPVELKDDASLTVEVRNDPASELRKRGLPPWLARKFYEKGEEMMQNPELTETGYKQLAQAANMIAKVDVETARFQLGEAAATQVQVNNVQTSPAELMKAYLNGVRDKINAAYPEPPPAIEVESESISQSDFEDQADQIAEAIKAEVPALKGMNGALSKIVKKVIDQKKDLPPPAPPSL